MASPHQSATWRIIRDLLVSDVVIAFILVTLVTCLMSTAIFFLSWLVYRDRYGISLMDFVNMTLL